MQILSTTTKIHKTARTQLKTPAPRISQPILHTTVGNYYYILFTQN